MLFGFYILISIVHVLYSPSPSLVPEEIQPSTMDTEDEAGSLKNFIVDDSDDEWEKRLTRFALYIDNEAVTHWL